MEYYSGLQKKEILLYVHMYEPRGPYAKWHMPVTGGEILHDST